MLVSNILSEKGREVITIAPEATLLEAANVLTRNRIGALVVKDTGGALAGIISERDIVFTLAGHGAAGLILTVAACMTKDVATCEESDTIDVIMETMTSCRFRHMPVVAQGRVVGIVSIGDIVKTRIAETMREAQALKQYIATG
jgi:CBS domain-containing protein